MAVKRIFRPLTQGMTDFHAQTRRETKGELHGRGASRALGCMKKALPSETQKTSGSPSVPAREYSTFFLRVREEMRTNVHEASVAMGAI
jgi:hypothetical protein